MNEVLEAGEGGRREDVQYRPDTAQFQPARDDRRAQLPTELHSEQTSAQS